MAAPTAPALTCGWEPQICRFQDSGRDTKRLALGSDPEINPDIASAVLLEQPAPTSSLVWGSALRHV